LAIASSFFQADSLFAQNGRVLEDEQAPIKHVVVTVNKSRTFRVDRPFATAVVGAPEIADVLPISDRSLYVQGKKVGTTNISVFDEGRRLLTVIDVEVTVDTGNLLHKIETSTGTRGIRVLSNNGQVVLGGEAPNAVAADRAVSVAKGLSPDTPVVNAMRVAPSQQVMLRVRFLEATRDASRALGVNWFASNPSGTRGVNTGSGAFAVNGGNSIISASSSNGAGGTASATTATSTGGIPLFQTVGTLVGTNVGAPFGVVLANVVNSGSGSVDLLISALETKGLVRRLAEPDLVALSGDTAAFLAGGEYPVPTVQPGGAGSVPVITTAYQPYGIQLTFSPTVLSNGKINLRLAPSVSELDYTNAVIISGFTVPALTKREARTTVELRDGQSFAIAGLLQQDTTGNISQIPWLGSVPVLGTLFRSTTFQKHESDLVVIVTPHLVSPAAPGQQLATPFDQRLVGNDTDVFVNGQLERKKVFQDYVTTGGDLEGPYGHIIRAEQGSNAAVFKR
jgi:pilus assembly protein CpaC